MNLRELLSARTENIKTARALASQADEENRDFSEAERAEFDRLMTEVEAQAVQINKITEERARLQEAEAAALEVIPQAEKPDGKSSKLLSRDEFEALPAGEKMSFVRKGGTIKPD